MPLGGASKMVISLFFSKLAPKKVNKARNKSNNKRSNQNIELQTWCIFICTTYIAKISGHNSTLICKKGVVNDEFKGSHKNQCRRQCPVSCPMLKQHLAKTAAFPTEISSEFYSELFLNYWRILWCHIQMSEQKS